MQTSNLLATQDDVVAKSAQGDALSTDTTTSSNILGIDAASNHEGLGQSPLSKASDLNIGGHLLLTSTTDDQIGLTQSSNFFITQGFLTQPLSSKQDSAISSHPSSGDPLTGQVVDDESNSSIVGSDDTKSSSLLEESAYDPLTGRGFIEASQTTPAALASTSSVSDSLLGTYEKLVRAVKTDLLTGRRYEGYLVDKVFKDKATGLYAVGLLDPNNVNTPLLVVRGTDSEETKGFIDDANPKGVGFDQYSAGKAAIEQWLQSITQDSLKNPQGYLPGITGESLGGAIAQSIAASYTHAGNKLNQVITFNSPGIDTDIASQLKTENVGQVLHMVAYGDLVSLAGESYVSGEYRLLDWDTENSKVLSVSGYILDKHNQEQDFLIGNTQITTKTGLSTTNLSQSTFSYWTHPNVSKAARADWALLNLELGLLSPLVGLSPGAIPAMLSNRGAAELSRSTLGGVIRELLEKRSDSLYADVLLKASGAIDAVGDVLINNMKEWNQETWAAVADWDPGIWGAIAASGLPAISYLAAGGAEAAEALASGGLLASTALAAGSIEAFEALTKGGVTAIRALAQGDGKVAWEAIIQGGDQAWNALNSRGVEAWNSLAKGGDNAWLALKNSGSAAWESLKDGGDYVWDLIETGVASKIFNVSGKKILEKIDSLGNLFEKVEYLADGQQIVNYFTNGVLNARNYFDTAGKIFKKVDFQAGGKQVIDYFTNGVLNARNYFDTAGKIFKKVDFQAGGKQVIDYFTNGVLNARNYFDTAGKIFKKVDFQAGGKQVIDYFTNGVLNARNYFDTAGKIFKKVDFQAGGKQVIDYFTNGVLNARNYFDTAGKIFKKVDFQAGGKQVIDYFTNGVLNARNYFDTAGKIFKKVDFQAGGKQVIDYFTNGVLNARNYFDTAGKIFKKVDFQAGGKQVIDYFTNGVLNARNYFDTAGKIFKKVDFLTNGGQIQHLYRNGREYLRRAWGSATNDFVDYVWDSSGTYLGSKAYNAAGNLVKGTGTFFKNAPEKATNFLEKVGIKF